jgi:NAD(P)-dependent dehydrogenase (short-subunit alcohol dehydrogenase family)
MFRTNVRGPLLLVQAAIPYLISPGGRIVNIGSIIVRGGSFPGSAYSATKATLGTIALGWGEQLGPEGDHTKV